jgi:ferric-dicitrate binding protein FerR (iron transport regulator)
MNRYNRHKLVIADPRLNTQRFGGSFPAGDCEPIVRMLEANFGVVAERGTDETRLRLKPR